MFYSETNMPFALNALGEAIFFIKPDGSRILDAVQFSTQQNGIAMGRWPDGANDFYRLQAKTPGAPNAPILISPVVINELMYDPISGNDDDQYVELYNHGTTNINLGNWQLAGGVTFTFPTNVMLASNGYMVVAKNLTNLLAKYPNLNATNVVGNFSGKLSHNGEYLALTMPAEHKPRHSEGPFFTNLLASVGFPNPDGGTTQKKRQQLIGKVREACARNGSGVVVLFCDEAQRFTENEYEWLRDVHDALDQLQIRLFTILVGQQELRSVKTAFQRAQKTQIVARLMVEELAFFGIRNAQDVATCLIGYDESAYPAGTEWTYTRFYLPTATKSGFRLVDEAVTLWSEFSALHHKHGFADDLEIPMESFTRAVEIVLKESLVRDAKGYRPPLPLWQSAVRQCGYVQSRLAVSEILPRYSFAA